MKIIEYFPLSHVTLDELSLGVNDAIKKGWQPLGAVSVLLADTTFTLEYRDEKTGVTKPTKVLFVQNLVRYQPDYHISQLGGPG